MTVRELKELLAKFDNNTEVHVYSSEWRCVDRVASVELEPYYENSTHILTYENLAKLGKRLNDAVVINGEGNNAS